MNKKIQTEKPFWSFSAKETLRLLRSDKSGLTEKQVKRRQGAFGLNKIDKSERFFKLKLFFRQFKSPLIFILLIAGTITLVVQKWVDATVIFLAVVVNTFLGFYQENRAENAVKKLQSYIRKTTRVIRDGQEKEVGTDQLVPGDVISLSYGDRIPADARLISSKNFSVDESILTGESLPVSKIIRSLPEDTSLPERKNMVFGGTLVNEGYAVAVVVSTASSTEIGKITKIVAETKHSKTPLQKAVSKLAWIIAGAAVLLVAGLFLLGISRGEPMLDMFLVASAVAVGAIPEALPVALTVILAVGVERLAKRKGIMRNLGGAETLGSTSVIMTDKTGTLTEADLELVNIAGAEEFLSNKVKDIRKKGGPSGEHKEILKRAVFNTDVLIENPEDKADDWRILGKSLEVHIVKSAQEYGIDTIGLKKKEKYNLTLPFNSKNKFSVSHIRASANMPNPFPDHDSFYVIIGAPDILLNRSDLDRNELKKAHKRVEAMSNQGKRLVGVAVMPPSDKEEGETISPEAIQGVTFMGVLAFFDPVRPEVPDAVKRMEDFGVRVVMATGDLKGTAVSVAKELGWKVKENQVITGEELEALSDKQLLNKLNKTRIYARVTPEDKMRISKLFKKRGEVVGMTGDGVNDAPSLKSVDIGIAVGSGSDVAKEVSDLVLLDDNFKTIVAAIEEGKRILHNIRKSFVYLMSFVLDELTLIGSSLLVGLALPLTALQIIWVNFITGSLPALSFAFDNLEGKKEAKKPREGGIINKQVKFLTITVGVLNAACLFALYWFLATLAIPGEEVRTFIFLCFASYTIFSSLSFRDLDKPIFSYNPFSNKFLDVSIVLGVLLIAAVVLVPFMREVFGTVLLAPKWYPWLGGWIIFEIVLVESMKFIYRGIRD